MSHQPKPIDLIQNADIILKTIESIVILIDREGTVVAMNQAAEKTTGYSAKEIINQTHWSVFVPDNEKPKVEKVFNALIHGHKTNEIINHWITKHGEQLSIKWNNTFIRDENDDIQFVVATGTNITPYDAANADLRLSSSLFEATDPCVIADDQNRIVRVNKAFTEVTGYHKDEVIGKNPNLLSSGLHDKKFYRQMWENLLEKGTWSGEVINRTKSGSLFTEFIRINAVYDDNGKITHYVSTFLDISKSKENEDKLKFLSKYDAQTGLVNRHYYIELIANDLTNLGNQKAALLYLRLKNLNTLNAHYGIKYTDSVLLKFLHQVEHLIDHYLEDYTLARISGSDFAIHFKQSSVTTDKSQDGLSTLCEAIATRLVGLAQSFKAEANQSAYDLMAHFGILLLPEDCASSHEMLLSHAATACEEAIRQQADFVYFSQPLQDSLIHRHNLELALSQAIDQDFLGFELYHQPQFDHHRQLIGGELLLRWCLNGTQIPPDQFIPLAEKNRTIIQINRWVFNQTIKQLIELRNTGLVHTYRNLSINLSAICLADPELIPFIKLKAAEYPFILNHITLEITETAFIHDISLVREKIFELKRLGFLISIDDFGTGYSSLSYLSEFVFDEIKIDKSFIDHVGSKHNKAYRIAKSIIGIAEALEVKVIAEGIETEEQLNTLIEMNCCNFQGFYLKRPIPFKELIDFLQQTATG